MASRALNYACNSMCVELHQPSCTVCEVLRHLGKLASFQFSALFLTLRLN